MSRIPIQNVYYLLLYAWRHAQRQDLVSLSGTPHTELKDLLGHVLANEVTRLVQRGLSRDYVPHEGAVEGIRGKMDIGVTVRNNLLGSGKTYCRFDELSYDVLRNRIVKATLRDLSRVRGLDATIGERLRHLYQKLDRVDDVTLHQRDFGLVQSHRLFRDYDFVLRLCRLIWDNTILDRATGSARFNDFREDEARMWQLFEDFVREFYHVEQQRFTVSHPQIKWFEAQGTDDDLAHLPGMQTDVVLEEENRSIVLDVKYYENALRERHGAQRLISGHLYQLFAYLENRSAALPHVKQEGMLLYPVVDQAFAFSYRLKGYDVRIRAVDLSRPWQEVRAQMLSFIN